MENLINLFERYLQKKSEYAIQLTGVWGRGKTHFYRNRLEPLVRQLPTLKNAAVMYTPVYISLFGLQSVEDIKNAIFYDLVYGRVSSKTGIPKKTIKFSISLGKLLLSAITDPTVKTVSNTSPSITKFAKEYIDTADLLIVLDDLERRSAKLTLADLAGYVNNLSEAGVKVLLITNATKLGSEYAELKDKVVGLTLEYNPETAIIIDEIINSRYRSSPAFQTFLRGIKDTLVAVSKSNENNFRSLIYAIDMLQDVYVFIRKNFLDAKTEISQKVQQELNNIAHFTLIHAIEHKHLFFTYEEKETMQDYNWITTRIFFEMEKGDTKEVPLMKTQILTEKYFRPEERLSFFYTTLFDFIVGFFPLDVEAFQHEFIRLHHLERGKVSAPYRVLNALSYDVVFDMDTAEYKTLTADLLKHAEDGAYALVEYLSVHHYIFRFDNILDLDPEEVHEKLMNGMRLAAQNKERMATASAIPFEHDHSQQGEPGREALRDLGIALIREYQAEQRQKAVQEIADLVENNLDGLQEIVLKDDSRQSLLINLDFSTIDMDKLFKQLVTCKMRSIMVLESLTKDRLEMSRRALEREALAQLLRMCESYLGELRTEKSLNKWHIQRFAETIEKIIDSARGAGDFRGYGNGDGEGLVTRI